VRLDRIRMPGSTDYARTLPDLNITTVSFADDVVVTAQAG
jgi:hypothetical protein